MIDSVTEEECVNNGYENPESPGYMQVAGAVSKRVRLHLALIRNFPVLSSMRILQSVSKVNGIKDLVNVWFFSGNALPR